MCRGLSSGVEFFGPCTASVSRENPALCRTVATMASMSSASALLVPVISTSMFLVLVVTVVRAEFMMGGNEMTFWQASRIIGTESWPASMSP